MSCSSPSVGFWPRLRMTVPNSIVVILPSPSLSKRLKASRNSKTGKSIFLINKRIDYSFWRFILCLFFIYFLYINISKGNGYEKILFHLKPLYKIKYIYIVFLRSPSANFLYSCCHIYKAHYQEFRCTYMTCRKLKFSLVFYLQLVRLKVWFVLSVPAKKINNMNKT